MRPSSGGHGERKCRSTTTSGCWVVLPSGRAEGRLPEREQRISKKNIPTTSESYAPEGGGGTWATSRYHLGRAGRHPQWEWRWSWYRFPVRQPACSNASPSFGGASVRRASAFQRKFRQPVSSHHMNGAMPMAMKLQWKRGKLTHERTRSFDVEPETRRDNA